MGRPALDLIGKKFGKLTIIRRHGIRGHQVILEALCDCGNTVLVNGSNVIRGKTKACGCLRSRTGAINPSYKHGMTGTPEHAAYRMARSRCLSKTSNAYDQYGGRGIKFLFVSFEQWFRELGYKPSSTHSVDRIRNEGHYEPGNVRWATKSEQVINRRKIGSIQRFSTDDLIAELSKRIPEYGICGC